MADETPKKVVEDSSRRFTCPSLSADNNRVFIIGKSDHSFADIIKTSLNVDVNCYANLTASCSFARMGGIAEYPAQVSVSLKNEKYYNGHYCYSMYVNQWAGYSELGPRPADEDLEQDRAPLTASESASGLSSTNRAKASKSLQFSSKDISTTCVSSTNSKQPLPAGVRRLAYFPKVSSPIQPVENQNYRPTEFKSVDGPTRLLQFANKLALQNVYLDHEGKNSNTY